jgi:iron complex transport system ATP-binding protein
MDMTALLSREPLSFEQPSTHAVEGPAVLEASRLAVGWEGRAILQDLDLSVLSGERVALLGSNGSGKTTLLRVLAGLAPPLCGELRWLGSPLPRGPSRCKVLSFVFQAEPPSHFTVRELVTLGLGLDGPPSVFHEQRVSRVLETENLDSLADRRCSSLSGGEWQRCAIARALVSEPALLLLDEPTNHLDPARRAVLHERLARFSGQALVLATHDLELAALCDRVVLLGDGRVVVVGRPSDVLTPDVLRRSLGVRVRRLDDPEGGPPLFRIVGFAPRAVEGEGS